MLVLEPDENELLQEDSVMIQNDARIDDGILHITNRRIITIIFIIFMLMRNANIGKTAKKEILILNLLPNHCSLDRYRRGYLRVQEYPALNWNLLIRCN